MADNETRTIRAEGAWRMQHNGPQPPDPSVPVPVKLEPVPLTHSGSVAHSGSGSVTQCRGLQTSRWST